MDGIKKMTLFGNTKRTLDLTGKPDKIIAAVLLMQGTDVVGCSTETATEMWKLLGVSTEHFTKVCDINDYLVESTSTRAAMETHRGNEQVHDVLQKRHYNLGKAYLYACDTLRVDPNNLKELWNTKLELMMCK